MLLLCVFQMTVWQALLLCVSLSCVLCVPSEVIHRKYMRSYNITRATRCRVQHLLAKYVSPQSSIDAPHLKYSLKLNCLLSPKQKREQMGSSDYEDRSQHLQGLPSPSTDFFTWLKLTVSPVCVCWYVSVLISLLQAFIVNHCCTCASRTESDWALLSRTFRCFGACWNGKGSSSKRPQTLTALSHRTFTTLSVTSGICKKKWTAR